MKTYNEYLAIIKKREKEEFDRLHKGHDHSQMYCIAISPSRMTFDYSVEIMGMMMEDFTIEIRLLLKREIIE